jgi:hypothetical protein
MTAACFAPPRRERRGSDGGVVSGGAREGVLAMDANPGPPTGGAHYSFDWIGGSMLAGGRPISLRGKYP